MGRNEGWQATEVLRHLCIRHLAGGGGEGGFGQPLLEGDDDATLARLRDRNERMHMTREVKPADLNCVDEAAKITNLQQPTTRLTDLTRAAPQPSVCRGGAAPTSLVTTADGNNPH